MPSFTRPGVTVEALATCLDGTVWALETQSDGSATLLNTGSGRVHFITDVGQLYGIAIAADGTIWVGGDGRLYRVDPLD